MPSNFEGCKEGNPPASFKGRRESMKKGIWGLKLCASEGMVKDYTNKSSEASLHQLRRLMVGRVKKKGGILVKGRGSASSRVLDVNRPTKQHR